MATSHLRWTISAGWILTTIVTFLLFDASSTRSWLYLITAALVPPTVLLSLWPARQQQSISDVMHGTSERSS